MQHQFNQIFTLQRSTTKAGTFDYAMRIKLLRKLKNAIIKFETEIYEALYKDLHKSHFEAYATEIGIVLEELGFHLKHLKKWIKPKRVSTPITNFPASSYITYEPKGVVLIISPWNYPFQLLIAPLIGAISAGNSAILKPSEISKNTALLLEKIINTVFEPEIAKVFLGSANVSQELLKLPFDHIFFTGSPRVGKIVMMEAAKNMTPVTLELGGKSPCIVDENINLKLAARRIVWGKLLNAGQTCIAPDYLLVHSFIKEKFLPELTKAIEQAYGTDPFNNTDYPRIISEINVERLKLLIKDTDIYYGGNFNAAEHYFAPTIVNNVTFDMPLMQQEIFGPIIPIITFNDYNKIIDIINNRPKPLSLYIFTRNKTLQNRLLLKIPAGGACVNDTIMHIAGNRLPFGGIGNSGTGKYHGKYSFETFSNIKAVVKKPNWLDVPVRYAPFGNKLKIIKLLMR